MTAAGAIRVRHGGLALPWRTFLLVATAIVAYLCLGPAPEAWVFDRIAIAKGEWWRLLTGHWVHSDAQHALWDIAALLLFGMLLEARLRWLLVAALLFATAGVDAWLWWGQPELQLYCGLSGIFNGLLAAGLMLLWRDFRHPVVLLTAVGAALKIVVEIQSGQALFTQTAWASVPAVHGVGFLCGAVLAWGLGALVDRPARRRGKLSYNGCGRPDRTAA